MSRPLPRGLALGLLGSISVIAYLLVRPAEPWGGAAPSALRDRGAASGPFDPVAARTEALARASAAFGRELRDGTGPGCDRTTRLARTSAHQLIKLETRLNMGSYLDSLGIVGPGIELGVQRAEFTCDTLLKWTNVTKYYCVVRCGGRVGWGANGTCVCA